MYEYNLAVASAQSAGKWHEFSEYADRYYLQYRTAKDERVREEHAILDGITLPFDDKFWDEFFPPNGWNCRCEAIQVSKKRYEPSNPSEALARGRAATYKPNADGVNKAAIFRFNPGKEQRIFPKKHPYFPKGCGDCGLNQYATGKRKMAMCFACEALNVIRGDITGYDLENVGKNKIFISRQQDAAEKENNLVIAKYLASRHKNDIILLPNIPNEKGLKNVDSFNVTKNRFEEYKFCTSSKPNTIDVEVKEASKQSSYAIIYLKTKPDSMKRLKKLLQRRVNRHDGLKEVFVIFEKKEYFFRKTNRKPK